MTAETEQPEQPEQLAPAERAEQPEQPEQPGRAEDSVEPGGGVGRARAGDGGRRWGRGAARRPLSLRRVVVRSLATHRARTAILLVLVAAQAACALSGLVLVQSMRLELSLAEQRLGADLLVYPTAGANQLDKEHLVMLGTPVEYYRARSTLSRMGSNDDIESVSYQIYLSDTAPDGRRLWIVGFDPDTDFVVGPWLADGADHELADGTVAAGSEVGVSSSGTVELFQRERTVSAHLAETGSELDSAVFVTMDTLEEVIEDSVAAGVGTYASLEPGRDYSVALVRLKDKDDVGSVTAWVNTYVRKVTAVGSDAALTATATDVRGHTGLLATAAGGMWLVLLVALAVAQSVLVNERRQELRVWYTIGASRRTVSRVMLGEAALVQAAGTGAGTLVAAVVLALAGGKTVADGLVTPSGLLPVVALTLLVSLVTGCVSTWLVVRRATRRLGGQVLLT